MANYTIRFPKLTMRGIGPRRVYPSVSSRLKPLLSLPLPVLENRIRNGEIPELRDVSHLQNIIEKGDFHNGDALTHTFDVFRLGLEFMQNPAMIPSQRVYEYALSDLGKPIFPGMPHTRKELVSLSLLLHDIGKGMESDGRPVLQVGENGFTRCRGHAQAGSQKAYHIARSIGLPITEAKYVAAMVLFHMHTYQFNNEHSLERLFSQVGFDAGFAFLKLADTNPARFNEQKEYWVEMLNFRYTVPKIASTGPLFHLLNRLTKKHNHIFLLFNGTKDDLHSKLADEFELILKGKQDALLANIASSLAYEQYATSARRIRKTAQSAGAAAIMKDRIISRLLEKITIVTGEQAAKIDDQYDFDYFPEDRPVLLISQPGDIPLLQPDQQL